MRDRRLREDIRLAIRRFETPRRRARLSTARRTSPSSRPPTSTRRATRAAPAGGRRGDRRAARGTSSWPDRSVSTSARISGSSSSREPSVISRRIASWIGATCSTSPSRSIAWSSEQYASSVVHGVKATNVGARVRPASRHSATARSKSRSRVPLLELRPARHRLWTRPRSSRTRSPCRAAWAACRRARADARS